MGYQVWRLIVCLRYLTFTVEEDFTLHHFLHLYSPELYRGGVFIMFFRGNSGTIFSSDDNCDRGWYERFIIVSTLKLVHPDKFFPEVWNTNRAFSYLETSFLYLFAWFINLFKLQLMWRPSRESIILKHRLEKSLVSPQRNQDLWRLSLLIVDWGPKIMVLFFHLKLAVSYLWNFLTEYFTYLQVSRWWNSHLSLEFNWISLTLTRLN